MVRYFCDGCGAEFDHPIRRTFEIINRYGVADGSITTGDKIIKATLCQKCEESFLDWLRRPDLKTALEPKSFKNIFQI